VSPAAVERLLAYVRREHPSAKMLEPATWHELHRRALAYTGDAEAEAAWLAKYAARVTCGSCGGHWQTWTAENPPDLTAAASYFEWTVAAHNAVSERIGKPTMSTVDALARWKTAP
jgi:hypothetical protein